MLFHITEFLLTLESFLEIFLIPSSDILQLRHNILALKWLSGSFLFLPFFSPLGAAGFLLSFPLKKCHAPRMQQLPCMHVRVQVKDQFSILLSARASNICQLRNKSVLVLGLARARAQVRARACPSACQEENESELENL